MCESSSGLSNLFTVGDNGVVATGSVFSQVDYAFEGIVKGEAARCSLQGVPSRETRSATQCSLEWLDFISLKSVKIFGGNPPVNDVVI